MCLCVNHYVTPPILSHQSLPIFQTTGVAYRQTVIKHQSIYNGLLINDWSNVRTLSCHNCLLAHFYIRQFRHPLLQNYWILAIDKNCILAVRWYVKNYLTKALSMLSAPRR